MKKLAFIWILLIFSGCIPDNDFKVVTDACEEKLVANATFEQVRQLYQGELLQIQEDWILEGYIISSDRAGNFFSVLHFQDDAVNPTDGFQIEIHLFESHLLFEPGSKVFVKTRGLYLDERQGVFRLGGTFSAFGTTTVGRLPALKIPEHIFRSCDAVAEIIPTIVTVDAISEDFVNTLVTFERMEFMEAELGLSFATFREETDRMLSDCNGNEIILRNSGFADFQAALLPEGNGSIKGVLLRENDDFLLVIRDVDDLDFFGERCTVSQSTSNQIFFSELADPNNNSGARFVELYNAAAVPLDLNGWTIERYTNANTEISSTIDLTGSSIDANATLVISPNAAVFETVYGFAPDVAVGTNSPADSNGDDNLVLVDPFGTVIDVFGVVGEDGSGTNHEFEDGRALRNIDVFQANTVYTFSEWTIFNDTGDVGTINLPQNAPDDFSPGVR